MIYEAMGWDYPGLCRVFEEGMPQCRTEHVPVLFHITELTQPLGHSTSGSQERYKTAERLEWEEDHDCLTRYGRLDARSGRMTTRTELDRHEKEVAEEVAESARECMG